MAPFPPSPTPPSPSSLPHPTHPTTTCIDNRLKRQPLKPCNSTTIITTPPSKKPKNYTISSHGKQNHVSQELDTDSVLSLDSIPSSIDFTQDFVDDKENSFGDLRSKNFYANNSVEARLIKHIDNVDFDEEEEDVCNKGIISGDVRTNKFYSNNSIEARLIKCRENVEFDKEDDDVFHKDSDFKDGRINKFYLSNSIEARLIKNRDNVEFDDDCELDLLLNLCGEEGGDSGFRHRCVPEQEQDDGLVVSVCCPLCGLDISGLSDEDRQFHTNDCLDKEEVQAEGVAPLDDTTYPSDPQVIDGSPVGPPKGSVNLTPVLDWLRNLGLSKYEDIFVREEIDWESLQWLTEEDLRNIGLTALGPRMKIVHALHELRRDCDRSLEKQTDVPVKEIEANVIQSKTKLITDFFHGSVATRPTIRSTNKGKTGVVNSPSGCTSKNNANKKPAKSRKNRDLPPWCSIQGTPFRVDAFKYLTRECSHWFLTHFHMDHYQGLTKSFCHGKVYCSSITAKLVHLKIGIPWERMHVLPLNQKIEIAGVNVTCFDANHCPGSVIILFEFSNGKSVLHTGDFRYTEHMKQTTVLQTTPIHTLILDTTYCDPQYDFPKQDAVIQYVIEAIQAEEFNPKTLFLIGSYTIGKERLFLEIGRVLRKKIYVSTAKLRILECLDLPGDVMQWLTTNEHESQIHVVPMWTLSTIKRLKQISNQYSNRFDLIVAFSPTGWSFGKGKKKSTGRRWQQGTLIRYEVPYSEHSSFPELKEFVEFLSPQNIIPSVNNHGPESSSAMISLLEQN